MEFCAVVKANAYGHGQKEFVNLCLRQGVKTFAVDSLDEALVLRGQSQEVDIIILGFTPETRFPEVVKNRLIQTVYLPDTLEALIGVARSLALTAFINLKLETGLHRQGADDHEISGLLDVLSRNQDKVFLFGLSSHLANSEELEAPEMTNAQIEAFTQLTQKLLDRGLTPKYLHLACSAAGLTRLDSQFTLVRFGLAMYGHWPSTSVKRQVLLGKQRVEIQPVLSWRTTVVQVKNLTPGDKVGYGMTFTANRPMRLAVLPVGYYDGYDRQLSNGGEVLVHGMKCPIIGRICMNICMVDVSAVPKVEVGDQVTLIGRDGMQVITAEDLATNTGTINYEILSRINPLLPKVVS